MRNLTDSTVRRLRTRRRQNTTRPPIAPTSNMRHNGIGRASAVRPDPTAGASARLAAARPAEARAPNPGARTRLSAAVFRAALSA